MTARTSTPQGGALALVFAGIVIATGGVIATLATGNRHLMGIAAVGFAFQVAGRLAGRRPTQAAHLGPTVTPAALRQQAERLLEEHRALILSTIHGTPWASVREQANALQAQAYELNAAARRMERQDNRRAGRRRSR
ncbi:hypothetical protein [Streptomyces sp. NPDC088794]|uniref:hypothetical protein n=1 Tax=Streptomyces sp. NPDC088794 TaxID=3365902 RepID=UPI003824226A